MTFLFAALVSRFVLTFAGSNTSCLVPIHAVKMGLSGETIVGLIAVGIICFPGLAFLLKFVQRRRRLPRRYQIPMHERPFPYDVQTIGYRQPPYSAQVIHRHAAPDQMASRLYINMLAQVELGLIATNVSASFCTWHGKHTDLRSVHRNKQI